MRHELPAAEADELNELGLVAVESQLYENGGVRVAYKLEGEYGWTFTAWRSFEGARFIYTAFKLGIEVHRSGFHHFSRFVRVLNWRRDRAAEAVVA